MAHTVNYEVITGSKLCLLLLYLIWRDKYHISTTSELNESCMKISHYSAVLNAEGL